MEAMQQVDLACKQYEDMLDLSDDDADDSFVRRRNTHPSSQKSTPSFILVKPSSSEPKSSNDDQSLTLSRGSTDMLLRWVISRSFYLDDSLIFITVFPLGLSNIYTYLCTYISFSLSLLLGTKLSQIEFQERGHLWQSALMGPKSRCLPTTGLEYWYIRV